MRKSTFLSFAASGLTAATIGLAAPGVAAPSGPGTAQDTVTSLQANGFKAILNKLGSAPLDQCTVTAIRPGQQVTGLVPTTVGNRHLEEQVLYTSVYVDVRC
jgi:hypothetical protein